ncbi:MAG: lytic murein transglycosylase B [Acidiferrobacterales bacterium]
MRSRAFVCLGLPIFLLLPNYCAAISPDDYPELRAFVQEVSGKYGLSKADLYRWFRKAKIRQDILAAIRAPKEALPWYRYRPLFVTQQSAVRGERFWQAHARALARAESEYGVDPATIVAILGIETQYGRNPGRFRVMDSLTTLMLEYPKRQAFFRQELEQYLLLTRELKIDPLALRGSYAGAIGVPQFIPSSYRHYAVDFDGDRVADIVNSVADAIGSVANYIKEHGWQRDGRVVADVTLEGQLPDWLGELDPEPVAPLKYLISYGILPVEYNHIDQSAAVIKLEEESGPVYYFGYNNFYVITRYNRSRNYAMAVYKLSKLIRQRYNRER